MSVAARRAHVAEGGVERSHRRLQMVKAVGLRVACQRLGIGYRTGQRLIAEGKFPIPYLRRRGTTAHYRFSTHEIDLYLTASSVEDVR